MARPENNQRVLDHDDRDHASTVTQATRIPVPGDSPAYFNGDPSNDALSITKFHLIINPPERLGEITFALWGVFKTEPGTDARYKLSLSRNGTRWGPDHDGQLSDLAKITQGGIRAEPPFRRGPVEMTRTIPSPTAFYQKGDYTLRVQLWTATRARMTDFEGTIYIDGPDEDYRGERSA